MKIILFILIILTMIIGFSFTIIGFYTDKNGIPYLYNGGYFYIVSSLLLISLALVFKKYKYSIAMWMKIVINISLLLYLLSALVFALISLYDMPQGYLNTLASTMLVSSIMLTSISVIFFNKKLENNFYTVLWIIFAIFLLYIGGTHSLIQVFNSPDNISHVLYGSIIYFLTVLSFFILIIFMLLKTNQIVIYSIVILSSLFLWIGVKIFYSLINCVNSYDVFISYILLCIGTGMLFLGIFLSLKQKLRVRGYGENNKP